jgi:hypothetical protein
MFDRKVDQFKNGVFTWFIGEVKDINDSKNLNRVRVNAYGYYDGVENVADLPWATVMMPTTSASIKGNGSNHHLEVGSWVVGFFADGPSAQDPIIMGSIATQTNGVKDIPSDASVDNKVYESKAGHRIELDNTSGKEKIIIKHGKTGAFLEFNENNKIRIV